MRITFIINGIGRGRAGLVKSLSVLKKKKPSWQYDLTYTESKRHAEELTRQTCMAGAEAVIAVGGDGTLNEVVNGWIKFREETPLAKKVMLGLLPYGTANDFAKTIAVNNDILLLINLLEKGMVKYLKIGTAILSENEKPSKIRHFINIADVGMGAEVVKYIDQGGRRWGADFTFFKSIIRAFFTYRKRNLLCQGHHWKRQGKVLSLAIGNGQFFGSGMCITPEASPLKDDFEVTLIGNVSIIDYLIHLNSIKKGKKINHAEVQYETVAQLKITGVRDIAGLEVDGEFVGYGNIEIKRYPEKVPFLMP